MSKVKKCYKVILKGRTWHNKYFYVSCQLRVINCPSLLGRWGSPQWETYSAETERPRQPEGASGLVTLLVIKHGALWGRQIRDLVEKCIYLGVKISEIFVLFFHSPSNWLWLKEWLGPSDPDEYEIRYLKRSFPALISHNS